MSIVLPQSYRVFSSDLTGDKGPLPKRGGERGVKQEIALFTRILLGNYLL